MAELTAEISKELLVSMIEDKMNLSNTLMTQYRSSQSWTDQKKFEFHYGQYLAFKEIFIMLKNM